MRGISGIQSSRPKLPISPPTDAGSKHAPAGALTRRQFIKSTNESEIHTDLDTIHTIPKIKSAN